jgi:hypothetical protein
LDVAAFAMTEGAAQRGRYDYRETGAKGNMDQDFGGEPGCLEYPQEQRHEDDPAADAEQAGEETCQASQDGKQCNTQKAEGIHSHLLERDDLKAVSQNKISSQI